MVCFVAYSVEFENGHGLSLPEVLKSIWSERPTRNLTEMEITF